MNTRMNVARRLEEEVAKTADPPLDDQVPPLEEKTKVDQSTANPQAMTEAEMWDIIAEIAQAITTQAQDATVQDKAMTAQANREISLYPHQQVTTMASRPRDFTRMNPPSFYGYKVMKTPKNSSMRF